MEFNLRIIGYIAVIILLRPTNVLAHSGGTNKDGCHNDNKNGGYHCHNSKESSEIDLATVSLVGAATYWLITSLKTNKRYNYNVEKNNKLIDKFDFALTPTSVNGIDNISFQITYSF